MPHQSNAHASAEILSDSSDLSDATSLSNRFRQVRELSHSICDPLETEDFLIQSMPDASPTRWHLAHTTWFFETFVLESARSDYRSRDDRFKYLFNSYYNAVGPQFPRTMRGTQSRPTVQDIFRYRRSVDEAMLDLLSDPTANIEKLAPVVELGLNHEQQHQELMLTDLKHAFSCNPLFPVYRERKTDENRRTTTLDWISNGGGIHEIGHEGDAFAYDNELPKHRAFIPDHAIGSRLVTNDEYRAFIEDGGYSRPELWLSEAWATIEAESWKAPLYWICDDGRWMQFTLAGLTEVRDDEPVCHVSYFEADAFARWSDARLPTEAEWEFAAQESVIAGNFVESARFHPAPDDPESGDPLRQIFGDVWEWTQSSYSPYPGYRPAEGALGEYNGKFMCNQFVLRGGSCATSVTHIRPTYRNFFPPAARWQFSGIRLARDE
jgi:ergothioneine biosynthesis protein EgtB